MRTIRRFEGRGRELAAAAVLLLLVAVVFLPVVRYGFLGIDDDVYVARNPHVRQGLTPAAVGWALTSFDDIIWMPVTRLSYLVDASVWGLDPRGFHLTNLLLHAAGVLVVFLLLRRLTGSYWRSLLVAGLCAVHPLRVEPVAWIADRKDLLGFLGVMLSIGAYARWAAGRGRRWYVVSLGLFVLAAGAKAATVVLPLLLLLVDLWPLGRLRPPGAAAAGEGRERPPGRLLAEKLPFLAVSVAVAALAVAASASGRYGAQEAPPLLERLGIAVATCGVYLERLAWPARLAVAYPPASLELPVRRIAAVGLLLVLLTVGALRQARRRPALCCGWLWYLVALLPVLGLVAGRFQPAADRYAYLPLPGLFVVVAWGLGELAAARPRLRMAVAVLAAAWVLVLAGLAARQRTWWRGTVPLLEHALAVTEGNAFAHANLGLAFMEEGRAEEAAVQLEAALRLKGNAEVAYDLGNLLAGTGDLERAMRYYREAIRLRPGFAEARNNLGSLLVRTGRTAAAIGQFRAALAADPGFARAHYNWAMALLTEGRRDEAAAHLRRALALDPGYAAAAEALAGLPGPDGAEGGGPRR